MILTKEEIIFCYGIITKLVSKRGRVTRLHLEPQDLVSKSLLHLMKRRELIVKPGEPLQRIEILLICSKFAVSSMMRNEINRSLNKNKFAPINENLSASKPMEASHKQLVLDYCFDQILDSEELEYLRLRCECDCQDKEIAKIMSVASTRVRYLFERMRAKVKKVYDIR